MSRIAPPELVEELANIWADVLALESVAPADDFFKLGGDSLSAMKLAEILAQRYGVVLDPIEVFMEPVLEEFASRIADALPQAAEGFQEGAL